MTVVDQTPLYHGHSTLNCLQNAKLEPIVSSAYQQLERDLEEANSRLTQRFMARQELSFHNQIKLLGFLALDKIHQPGDILEIGVWKGKSLSLMSRLSTTSTKVIGVDPCEIPGQFEEAQYFLSNVAPNTILIKEYSERSAKSVLNITRAIKLLHIDGGHFEQHVWSDFILYERFVTPGGYIVFDDYDDHQHSPEVRVAVDSLFRGGFFNGYIVHGPIENYPNSFVLEKTIWNKI